MKKFDVGIIGGGIAGSCCAILLAKEGKKVVLFEKDDLPKHRVCGEFISLETYAFFKSLGLDLDQLHLPIIKKLKLTAPTGEVIISDLDMGGFGISRYLLDFELMKLAKNMGVSFLTQIKVNAVQQNEIKTNQGDFKADTIIAAHGKNSANYISHVPKNSKKKNYVGVKYHVRGNFDKNEIALHSFEGGYCGMSKVEDNTYCLCYLADSNQLKKHGSIEKMEKSVLLKNPFLKEIFKKATFVWDKPLTMSNISIESKNTYSNGVFFIGDAAGGISPLSGNGMSIAAASAQFFSKLLLEYQNTDQLVKVYQKEWRKNVGKKTQIVKKLNSLMIEPKKYRWVLKGFKKFPKIHNILTNYVQQGYFSRKEKNF
jgi:flavin-dependent dehydrogenase